MSSDTPFWVAVSRFSRFGPVRFRRLQEHFFTLQDAFNAPIRELETTGIDAATAAAFADWRRDVEPIPYFEQMQKNGINVVTTDDLSYPQLLREIPDHPPVLYWRGNLNCAKRFCLAVVGSRKYTSYGERVIARVVRDLASNGLAIVSGLALGIDALAHEAALAGNGLTIAVLGSGIDDESIYPRANVRLAQRILENGGLLLSEFPPQTPPLRHHFPQRNRLVAGLALGTLVVEAAAKSGALITAQLALDYNREVLAVPGSIFNTASAGTNHLIRNGAQLVQSAADVMNVLALDDIPQLVSAQKALPDTPREREIVTILQHEPLHSNALSRRLKLDSATINATLVTMELKGYVKHLGGGTYGTT